MPTGKRLFCRRDELRINPMLVAAGIDSIPANTRQVYGVETVQAERRSMAIQAQALVAQASRNPVCSQNSCKQVTLGVTVPAAFPQDLGCGARNRRQPVVRCVFDFVPHPFETRSRDGQRISRIASQPPRARRHVRMKPVDDAVGLRNGCRLPFGEAKTGPAFMSIRMAHLQMPVITT